MTTPEPFPGRPVPDAADLRLLAEIINVGAVGLPQAAWNAGMSQSEAAARLVTMAERGMPLRLVAEGDRQLLWQIAQAGPVPPLPPTPAYPPAPGFPPAPEPPTPTTGPIEAVATSSAVPPADDAADDPAPTTGPIAVVQADAPGEASGNDPAAVWGVPGTSTWVRPPDSAPADVTTDPDVTPVPDDDSGTAPDPAPEPEASEDTEAAPATRRVLTSGQPVQAVEGLFGEQLDVGLQQILDPADKILTAVGYRIDPSERALLVQTSVGNRGPADYESLTDLYLEIVDGAGTVLRKAAMSVNGYPAHQVGVPANTLVSGWTVFLVPVETVVAQVRWSVRPDLAHRTVTWGFGPAPAGRD